MKSYSKKSTTEIFSSDDSSSEVLFTDEFTNELHQCLGTILSKYPNFTPTEADNKRTRYFEQFYKFLSAVHIKKSF